MSRAKRPRRPPDVSKGPRPVQASKLPDRRPPKRGKSGSPLATGNAKALNRGKAGVSPAPAKGTSVGGKPIGASDLSAIPSSEAPRPGRRGKSKGKVQEPEQKLERRTLTTREQQEMALRAVRITVEARRRERALKRETKTERDAIKALRAQAETLETQADQGYELVPEGDLFADRNQGEPAETIGGGERALSPASADDALRKIAGGNGKLADELPPASPPLADDLDAAARRDLAESAASHA